MSIPRRSCSILVAAAIVLASCSEPARPQTPSPEVPVRPAPPELPPAGSPPTTGPAISAARLPSPVAAAGPLPEPAAAPTPAPQDQGSGEVDMAITDALRSAIRDRRELSAEAHALVVTTREGVVTLRGAVADETERDAVLSLAHALPGVQRVDDRLDPIVR